MSRICCINYCDSKSEGDNNIHFFHIPKDQCNREKWEKIIGSNFKESRKNVKSVYICSRHFKPDDLDISPVKILKDDKIEIVPRKRPRLKRKAVPFICNEPSNKKIPLDITIIRSEILIEGSTINPIYDNKNKSMIEVRDEEQNLTHESPIRDTTEEETIEDLVNTSKSDLLKNSDDISYTTLRQEIINLKSKDLPRNWRSVVVPAGVVFLYSVDMKNVLHKARTVLIKWDMTTEIRGDGRLAAFPTCFKKIESITDVNLLLNTIGQLYLCDGNGYGGYCADVFFESKVTPKTKRCVHCRVDHKRKYRNIWSKKQRLAYSKKDENQTIKKFK